MKPAVIYLKRQVFKRKQVYFRIKWVKPLHECVNTIDDGTIENEWGSINIDDEGMKTKVLN